MLAICSLGFSDLEREIEEGIGSWMARAFIAQRGSLDQPPISDWIGELGHSLVEHTPRQKLNYRFVVLDSPEANGFALPGGWIFITAGLLESMHSEDELAAVLAHELAHLAERDFQQIVLRNAIYLGVAQLLRDNEAGDWAPMVHAVQLVDGLRDSRRREARADYVGAAIAWRGGYDPREMTAFLGEGGNWSYLQSIFATHPHPQKRAEWLDSHFEQLRADDPGGLNDLAASLVERGRYRAAMELLEQPLPGPHEQRRMALLERISVAARPRPPAGGRQRLAAEPLATLQAGIDLMKEGTGASAEKRSLAWRRLRRSWNDDQINRALLYAQAIDPEIGDPAYLALVAQTVHLMYRSRRGANLVGRTLSMQAAAGRGITELSGTLVATGAAPEQMALLEATAARVAEAGREIGERLPGETSELSRLAGEYHESGRLVAMLLAELGLSGEGYPVGRLVFSRFMVLQTQVKMLSLRIDRLDATAESIAAATWRGAIEASRLQLNVTGIEAGEAGHESLVRILSRRARVTAEQFQSALDDAQGAGDVTSELIEQQLSDDEGRFGSDLRALQILMRIASIETKEEAAWRRS